MTPQYPDDFGKASQLGFPFGEAFLFFICVFEKCYYICAIKYKSCHIMERCFNINTLVNSLTTNNGLKTYYTLLLMADTPSEKEAVDKRFWQKFDELPTEDKIMMRLALQQVEKNLLAETKKLHQEVKQFKEEFQWQ